MDNIDWRQTETLLEKNIRFIEKSTKIFCDVNKLRFLNERDYRIVPCEDGTSITIEKLTEGGLIRMHSAYEPQREGKLLAEKTINSAEKNGLYIRIGFGFGYLYNYFLPLAAKHECEVIVYEPSYDIFNFFIRLFDISVIFSDYPIKLFVHDDASKVHDIFPHTLNTQLIGTYAPATNGYFTFFREKVEECTDEIVRFFHYDKISYATSDYFNMKWVKNALASLPYVVKATGPHGFEDTLDGKPAIMVSSGPSLDKNVHLLKEVQGKVFIVAAYTTIKTMEAHGIYPDMFMALDSAHVPYTVGDDYDTGRVIAMLHPTLACDMFERHSSNYMVLAQSDAAPQNATIRLLFKELGKRINLPITKGGSVAHLMAEFLRYMGAGVIVLLGQDLAYTDNKHHASNYLEGQNFVTEEMLDALKATGPEIMVEDIYGNMVLTDLAFHNYLISFEGFAKDNLEKLEIVDATEGGAKIKNTKIMTFREAIDTYMKDCANSNFTQDLIAEARVKGVIFNDEEQTKVRLTLEKILKQCDEISAFTDDALKAAKKITDLFQDDKVPTDSELEKPIKKAQKFYDLMMENLLALAMANNAWMGANTVDIAMQRADEHFLQYESRKMTTLLTRHREVEEKFISMVKEAVEKLKEKGV